MQGVVRVSVEFMGPFEFDFGTRAQEVTLPVPATVATLVDALASRSAAGEKLRELLGDDTSPRRRYCYISIDSAVLAPDTELDAPLHDGARVCFGAPMAGG